MPLDGLRTSYTVQLVQMHFRLELHFYEIHIKRCLWLCVVFVSIECSAATAPMHHAHVNILVFTSVFSAGFFAPTYSTDPIEAS